MIRMLHTFSYNFFLFPRTDCSSLVLWSFSNVTINDDRVVVYHNNILMFGLVLFSSTMLTHLVVCYL